MKKILHISRDLTMVVRYRTLTRALLYEKINLKGDEPAIG